MTVDFHTHSFPDKIAEKTISFLENKGKVKAYHNGTRQGLVELTQKYMIDYSVVLPVATSVKQVESINRLSAELNGKDGLIYFAAIHPDCENVEEILDNVKNANIKGIKLHPDYQGVYFNDKRYIKIMEQAAKRDLLIVTHAGIDIGYRDDVHCTPDMVLEVLDELSGLIDNKLILAHMGACDQPDEVLEKLVGKAVYMDTAFVLDRYTEKCLEIIKKHGADKILFATDSPWADQGKFLDIIDKIDLSKEEKDKILYVNAFNLLNIKE